MLPPLYREVRTHRGTAQGQNHHYIMWVIIYFFNKYQLDIYVLGVDVQDLVFSRKDRAIW